MKVKRYLRLGIASILFGISFSACSSAVDDSSEVDINYVEDEECCSLDQEEQTLLYVRDLHELTFSESFSVDRFTVKIYTKGTELHAGYNDIYFTVEKPKTGRHVKDVEFSEITPLMTMGKMNMSHSTPVGGIKQVTSWIPVFHTWVAFLMPTDKDNQNTWALSFKYRINELEGEFSTSDLTVNALDSDDEVMKSFTVDGTTYFLSLANASDLKTGENDITAYISQKPSTITTAYPLAEKKFTVELTPTMPDMGNHTSPDNKALTYKTATNSYSGRLNLTMTGRWNIHLVVKDEDGNIVAGGTNDDSGYSNLYWSIHI
jgi:hypothetical protein